MYQLKENFENETIDDTLKIYAKIKGPFGTTGVGLVGNTNFTFTGTSDVDCVQDGKNFSDAHDKGISGSDLDKLAAKGKMEIFHTSLAGIAKQSNLQHTGNELELETTGVPMALEGATVGIMEKAVINWIKAVDGVEGSAKFNIVKTKRYNHGTFIEVKDVVTGVVIQYHTHEKHIFVLDVFTHRVDYMIRVCYDGTNKTKVWSDWKPFLGQ